MPQKFKGAVNMYLLSELYLQKIMIQIIT